VKHKNKGVVNYGFGFDDDEVLVSDNEEQKYGSYEDENYN
jgi:hypothetical protein